MTGQISESKIDEVRERTDIVALVSQYVSLKRSGTNHTGLCPFHSEKSPSFSVNAARQFFHCFGCGIGGDVFAFLMKIEGMAFPDAVRQLAGRAGIELEERTLTPEEERRQQQRERFYRVNEIAANYFHQLLMEHPAGEAARNYMRNRGYGRKAAEEYQIGYALDSWEALKLHLDEKGCHEADVRALGLIRPGQQNRGDYDLFRGRLIFPIHDLSGRVVAFAGRVLDVGKPKYINSPESPIYHKGQVLFGLYQARQAMRQSGEVLLVEGYFDQLALHRAGISHVVATCGTALTVDHARTLKRYVQRVLLLFDQDVAGRQATFKAMGVLQEEGVPALVIELLSGEDPDSFVQRYGSEAFKEKLNHARPVMEVFMEDVLSGTVSVEDKVRAAEKIIGQINGLSSVLEQDLYLKELAVRSGIELELLKQKQQALGRQSGRQKSYSGPPLPEESQPSALSQVKKKSVGEKGKQKAVGWSRAEETLICLLVHNYSAREKFLAAGGLKLLKYQGAIEITRHVLEDKTVSTFDLASLKSNLDPEHFSFLTRLIDCDQGQFNENVEQMLDDCLWKLKERSLKEKILNLQQVLIPEADKSGDTDQANRYRYELSALQLRVKARRDN